jgi:predicted  nucleic acid-binding Zn-ribbon protein
MTTAAKKAAPAKAEPKKESEAKAKDNGDDKPKRRSFTDEERIAKLQDDLNAARAKAAAKRTKAIESKQAEKEKLQEKIDKLRLEMAEIDEDIRQHTEGGSYFGEDLDAGDDPVVAAQDEATASVSTSDDDS